MGYRDIASSVSGAIGKSPDSKIDLQSEKLLPVHCSLFTDFPFCDGCPKDNPPCAAACPTGALRGDGGVELARCIQWYASGNGEAVPDFVRAAWGRRFYGCTNCQDACPHNQKKITGVKTTLGELGACIDAREILLMSDAEIKAKFKHTALGLSWLGPDVLRRNAACSLKNSPALSKDTVTKAARCHYFSLFFVDFPLWLDTYHHHIAETALLSEYDDLFKGTNANINIPLWASACKTDSPRLIDKTTLELIGFYKLYGFCPQCHDGNPPDFIGTQFQFLEYLYNKNADDASVADDFSALYLTPVINTVTPAILRYTKTAIFILAAKQLDEYKNSIANTTNNVYHTEKYLRPPRYIKTAGRNNCGGKCAVRVSEQEGCVLNIDAGCGLTGEPVMRACAKGMAYADTFLDGRRLRYPMRRVGERGEGRFKRISWDEAAEITAAQWVRIRDTYGPSSRYINYSSGVMALIRPELLFARLLNFDGGYLDKYNSYSSACARFTTPYIYGDNLSGNSFEDVLNTKLLILWGHNPAETIFDSERNYFIKKARDNGVRIIIIDPRENDSVRAFRAQWIGIRPSSDGALACAMAYVIVSEGLHDKNFIDKYCLGFDDEHLPDGIPAGESYFAYLFGKKDGVQKTPEWAEDICGVAATLIRQLALDYASAKPACIQAGLALA
jgi:anaerobic dimethyl sulfoxide reductase subunit A